MFDYFYQQQNEQYLFLQLPLMLIKDDAFKKLSDSSKILYSLLLNRTSLSSKNGWTDEQGRVYIIYTIEEMMKDLNCWEKKATNSMKELKEIGLIKTIRQGLGKPNLIYVMNFSSSLKYQQRNIKELANGVNTLNCQNDNSRLVITTNQEQVKSTIQDLSKGQSIYNDFKKIYGTDIESKSSQSQTEEKPDKTMTFDNDNREQNNFSSEMKKEPVNQADQSNGLKDPFSNKKYSEGDYSRYKAIIQENIEYDLFLQDRRNYDIQELDELVDCMLDVICTKGETVKINGEDKSRQMVISQYLKINMMDVEHILDRFKEQRHKITHIHNYLKTMLYTVKQENSHYYTNAVRVDGMV